MEIKAKIEEIVEKLTRDEKLMAAFKKDPAQAVKSLLGGADLPADALDGLVKGVQGKLGADKMKDALGGLKKLF